ncbi:sucrose phosphate synthase [Raphidocelis subcapitata]|uniref:sucrose-phosphate synthase n=1 Tax=Raphidocelis subcapitata TaxID=307507 RepID=A0A2V0PD63_9CHLO|nr:sucrose phosphate synthase [Raphidocelis subcapitata]|eukprot:GBF97791.1 sucrose phosphate synthase [Raphidocelis subcapitata]
MASSLLNNAWVDQYLDALLSSGLSTEWARRAAAEAPAAPPELDAESNIAARYYLHQILALDEESIQQAWLKVRARSSARLAAERDARLEAICWRVWAMRRKAAAAAAASGDDAGGGGGGAESPGARSASDAEGALSEAADDDELARLFGVAPPQPPAAGEAAAPEAARVPLALRRLAIAPRGGAAAAAAAELLDADAAEGDGGAAAAAAAAASPTAQLPAGLAAGPSGLPAGLGANLGPDRVPKLYCVLISLHGLVRGDRMELGKDPDTGGQVKYVVELARALARHPAVHRVDLLTRLIADPKVDASYGRLEERLGEPPAGRGLLGGARIVRLACGPTGEYLRKEALWPYVREFADNALAHVTATLARLAAAGEGCELYAVHGHYADAGEAAALMSFTLGSDMVLTGHSLGRNKLDHLLKSRTMTRREIEATYAISRRIEGEERSLDAAALVFASTQQEVKEQWGLYDGYDPALERILSARPRSGRHVPRMAVIPPGLDFSNLKVGAPPDPWEQLSAGGACGPASAAASQPPTPGARSRRASAAGLPLPAGFGAAAADAAAGGAGGGSPPATPTGSAAASPRGGGARGGGGGGGGGGSPFLRDAPFPELAFPSSATGASPRGPVTPLPGGGSVGGGGLAVGQLGVAALGPGGVLAAAAAGSAFEDPPIWQEIFRFLRNPRKPVILAMSRPDAKKNIASLVRAYGESRGLREIANLVLVMGNRSAIDAMAPGSAKVLEGVLKLVDAYDLYGSVAYPKCHSQDDISDIYLLPHHTRGVFVNCALQEPFGLTLIEAAAHGVPVVATTHGGPVDIVATLKNGLLVDPTDTKAIGEALLRLLTDPSLWEACAGSGRERINAYSWSSHCIRALCTIEQEKAKAVQRRKTAMRSTYSADLDALAPDRLMLTAGSLAAADAAVGGGEGAAAAAAAPPAAASATAEAGAALLAAADGAPGSPQRSGASFSFEPLPPPAAPAAPVAPAASQDDSSVGVSSGGSPRTPAPLQPPPQPLSPRAGGSLDSRAFSAMLDASTLVHGALTAAEVARAMSPKGRYVVLLLDSRDTAARLAGLLARKGGRALAALASGSGATVGVGVASAYGLGDTLRLLLGGGGLGLGGIDFLITNCGAQIWHPAAAASAAAAAAASDDAAAAAACVPDEGYDAFVDASWDKISVRRVLAQMLAQRGLLAGLGGGGAAAGARGGGGGGAAPPVKVTADTETGAHHLLLTLRRTPAAAGAAAAAAPPQQPPPPALSPGDLSALVARVRKRFRAGGLRCQVVAQLESDGAARLHITPLRASRALALRYLAHRHGVEMRGLVVVSCARELAPPPPAGGPCPAAFAASDAEDLLAGALGALVVPPPPPPPPPPAPRAPDGAPADAAAPGGGAGAEAAEGPGAGQLLGGFPVDLSLYTHDGRLQVLTGLK